jgi:glycosyltransferase involved in cell wall biosynthesis
MPRLTIQLCTYKRAALLERVLEALFDQTVPDDALEVVLVNDGSPDHTNEVIERVRPLARCAFTVIVQANAGLAKGRNAGIARATGERICFIDDDVLPTPVFAAEHLASDAKHGDVIVRGAVINTASFDDLPMPIWTPANYSGNYFWTSNVSLRRARLDRVGGRFDESFTEYGWEDIELGMRLRAIGTRAVFNRFAVAFHHKPAPAPASVDSILRQVRSQARTAVQLRAKHPHWRVDLAIGATRPQRALGDAVHRSGIARAIEPLLRTGGAGGGALTLPQRLATQVLATDAYYDELARAERPAS